MGPVLTLALILQAGSFPRWLPQDNPPGGNGGD